MRLLFKIKAEVAIQGKGTEKVEVRALNEVTFKVRRPYITQGKPRV